MPNVWNDFLHIRSAAMIANYNVTPNDTAEDLFAKTNFSFAAFDKSKPVGFIAGIIKKGDLHIDHLYVLPEYQKYHIGTSLLIHAEAAGAFLSKNATLTALEFARPFYEKHSYKSTYTINAYSKNISLPRCTVTPIFKITPHIIRACTKIANENNTAFDKDWIKSGKTQLFVYTDVNSEIQGYAIKTTDKNNVYVSRVAQFDLGRSKLEREMQKIDKLKLIKEQNSYEQ